MPFHKSGRHIPRQLGKQVMQSPVCGIFPEQRRQDRLDQCKATHPVGKRRIRRDLERDRATIGMTDEMKGSFRRAQGFVEMRDFLTEDEARGYVAQARRKIMAADGMRLWEGKAGQ